MLLLHLVGLARNVAGNDGSHVATCVQNQLHRMVVAVITPFWVSALPAQSPTRKPVTMQLLENLLQQHYFIGLARNEGTMEVLVATCARNRLHRMVMTAITPFWVSVLPAQSPMRKPVTTQLLENLLQQHHLVGHARNEVTMEVLAATCIQNQLHWMVVTAITPFWVSALPAQSPTRKPVTTQLLDLWLHRTKPKEIFSCWC